MLPCNAYARQYLHKTFGGYSHRREGSGQCRGVRTTNRPQSRWGLHVFVRPGLGHMSGDVSFISPC